VAKYTRQQKLAERVFALPFFSHLILNLEAAPFFYMDWRNDGILNMIVNLPSDIDEVFVILFIFLSYSLPVQLIHLQRDFFVL